MLTKIAYVFGLVFLMIGVLGFLPEAAPGGLLLGIFHVNTAHNLVHIATGVVAVVAAYRGGKMPKLFFQVFGVIYGAVAIAGFWYGAMPIFGMIANNIVDAVLHLVIAAVSLYLGFVHKE